MKIFLISPHGFNLINLLPTLEPEKNEITVIGCPKSIFSHGERNYKFIPLGNHDECFNFANKLIADTPLIDSLQGWVIFGDDAVLYEVANSSLSVETKLKILPVNTVEGLSFVGSKKGFAEISAKYNWKVPKSVVCDSLEILITAAEKIDFPVFVKADQGSGGAQVQKVMKLTELKSAEFPQSWFPVVAQQSIQGTECGLGLFYWHGELRFIDYSDETLSVEEFGPTYKRRIFIPQSFDALDSLHEMGRVLGLHGFVNGSSMFDRHLNSYSIFEMDLRPNAWHFLFNKLGYSLEDLIKEESFPGEFPLQPVLPGGFVYVHIISRHIGQILNKRAWGQFWKLALSSLTKKPNEILIDPIPLYRYVIIFLAKIASIALPWHIQTALRKKGFAYKVYRLLAKISA
jgi:hypothetical protein